LHVPAVALEATRRSLQATAAELLAALRDHLDPEAGATDDARLALIRRALQESQEFFARIPPIAADQAVSGLRVALLHGLDHMVRLLGYAQPPPNVRQAFTHTRLAPAVTRCREVLHLSAEGLRGKGNGAWLADVEQRTKELTRLHRVERPALFRQTADGEWLALDALDALDAMRWLTSIAHHAWRAGYYLAREGEPQWDLGQPSGPDY
ncbi:MAG TPA: hypothetical protein VLH09_11895, partial [Bryobacteraceae bacterium]|nr:hypothetical protein [Bryobacteraceae bacterium]